MEHSHPPPPPGNGDTAGKRYRRLLAPRVPDINTARGSTQVSGGQGQESAQGDPGAPGGVVRINAPMSGVEGLQERTQGSRRTMSKCGLLLLRRGPDDGKSAAGELGWLPCPVTGVLLSGRYFSGGCNVEQGLWLTTPAEPQAPGRPLAPRRGEGLTQGCPVLPVGGQWGSASGWGWGGG